MFYFYILWISELKHTVCMFFNTYLHVYQFMFRLKPLSWPQRLRIISAKWWRATWRIPMPLFCVFKVRIRMYDFYWNILYFDSFLLYKARNQSNSSVDNVQVGRNMNSYESLILFAFYQMVHWMQRGVM